MQSMTSNKPYLIRALYEWIVDNDCTPYLVVEVVYPGVLVPLEYAKDGQITLNVAPQAVQQLQIDNDWIFFSARFGGIEQDVRVPIEAVQACFARENGQGMAFEVVVPEKPPEPPVDHDGDKKPRLKVVK